MLVDDPVDEMCAKYSLICGRSVSVRRTFLDFRDEDDSDAECADMRRTASCPPFGMEAGLGDGTAGSADAHRREVWCYCSVTSSLSADSKSDEMLAEQLEPSWRATDLQGTPLGASSGGDSSCTAPPPPPPSPASLGGSPGSSPASLRRASGGVGRSHAGAEKAAASSPPGAVSAQRFGFSMDGVGAAASAPLSWAQAQEARETGPALCGAEPVAPPWLLNAPQQGARARGPVVPAGCQHRIGAPGGAAAWQPCGDGAWPCAEPSAHGRCGYTADLSEADTWNIGALVAATMPAAADQEARRQALMQGPADARTVDPLLAYVRDVLIGDRPADSGSDAGMLPMAPRGGLRPAPPSQPSPWQPAQIFARASSGEASIMSGWSGASASASSAAPAPPAQPPSQPPMYDAVWRRTPPPPRPPQQQRARPRPAARPRAAPAAGAEAFGAYGAYAPQGFGGMGGGELGLARGSGEPLDAAPPAAAPGELPSLGSSRHALRTCKPCIYFLHGMCSAGRDCGYCHLPHEGFAWNRTRPPKHVRDRLKNAPVNVRIQRSP